MVSAQKCSRCGIGLTEAAPYGLCPSCLLWDGLAEPEAKARRFSEGGGPGQAQIPEFRFPSPEARGQRFGAYELLEKVGQGGMGVVYKARQLKLDRIVALKLLPFGEFSRAEVVQRFQAEAAAAAGLQHPNIVAIHDVGEHEGQHYFSMDFIEGRTRPK